MSPLDAFLAADDLDEAAMARDALGPLSADDLARTGRAARGEEGPQARANVLMHPDLIPADLRAEALETALREGAGSYAALAATVGVGVVDARDLGERRATVVDALLDLVSADTGVVAARAAAATSGLLTATEAAEAAPLLAHPTPAARRNLLGPVLEVVGAAGLRSLLDSPGFVEPDAADDVRRVLAADGITVDDGVQAPLPVMSYLPNLADWHG